MKKENEIKSLIEDLEETVLRFHTWFRDEEEKNDQFKKVKAFFKKKGVRVINESLAKEIIAYHEYLYFRGKLYAYLYILKEAKSDVAEVIYRLRGIILKDSNTMMETKAHYSGIKGHFDTDDYLEFKKVIK
jgi:hypothetical protein